MEIGNLHRGSRPVEPQVEDSELHIYGIVSIEIIEASFLGLNPENVSGELFVRISSRNVSKSTYIARSERGDVPVRWRDTKHIPIVVSPLFHNKDNMIRIELFRKFATLHSQRELLGRFFLHVHDIIRHSPVTRPFDMYHRDKFICQLSCTVVFHYGLMGFGISTQLRMLPFPVEKFISTTLFPRVTPPEHRFEPHHYTIKPMAMPHPPFIPFRSKVVLGYGKTIVHLLNSKKTQKHEKLRSRMTRLDNITDCYLGLSSRSKRLQYLSDILVADNNVQEILPLAPEPTNPKMDAIDDFLRYLQVNQARYEEEESRRNTKSYINAKRFLSIAAGKTKRISVNQSKLQGAARKIADVIKMKKALQSTTATKPADAGGLAGVTQALLKKRSVVNPSGAKEYKFRSAVNRLVRGTVEDESKAAETESGAFSGVMTSTNTPSNEPQKPLPDLVGFIRSQGPMNDSPELESHPVLDMPDELSIDEPSSPMAHQKPRISRDFLVEKPSEKLSESDQVETESALNNGIRNTTDNPRNILNVEPSEDDDQDIDELLLDYSFSA